MLKRRYLANVVLLFACIPFFYCGNLRACDVPSGISVSDITITSATISWNTDAGASSFILQFHAESDVTWSDIVTTANTTTLTSLDAGAHYEFRVQAVCSADSSGFSVTQEFYTLIPAPDHIVICIMENKDFFQIVNSPSAVYINSIINNYQSALFENSFAIEHPSFPNYLDLFSGYDQGIHQDTCLAVTFTVENIGHQLIASGRSFTSYCENLPYDGYSGCATGTYVKKHNAAVYWQGTGANQIPSTTNLTFNAFPDSTDYASLPTLSFVIPDKINDMHDGTVEIGDAWLQDNLGSYIEWAQTNNSLFILTFDEADDDVENKIVTVFSGATVKTGLYSFPINHFGLLRTLEEMYGLSFAANADTATTIYNCWQLPGISTSAMDGIPSSGNALQVSPNPVSGNVTVSFTLDHVERGDLELYNLSGKLVEELQSDCLFQKGRNTFIFSRPAIDGIPGIYFIRLHTASRVLQQKLILQ